MAQRHLVPYDDGRWGVIDPEHDKVCVITSSWEDAIQRARRALGSLGGGTIVTDREGETMFTETVAPGSDPARYLADRSQRQVVESETGD